MALSWIVAGGGTGGHVTPALALGEQIALRGDRVLFVGSEQGLEAKLVPEAGFELITLSSRQVMGRSLIGRVAGLTTTLLQVGRARRVLREHAADIVVSVGGFAAVPAALAAVLTRTRLALVEPNAIPGRVNRLTARFASHVFLGFEAARSRLGGRPDHVVYTGVPLRAALVAAFDEAPPRKDPRTPLHLLVFGGSQGARQINEAMMELAESLARKPVRIFHQAGTADRDRVAAAYAAAGVDATVVDFERDMPSRYAWADLALCRAGALTVSELAMAALPSLLVPYPFAADDHQAANAAALAEVGAARCIPSRPFDVHELETALCELIDRPDQLAPMSEAASRLAHRDAAARIVDVCATALTARSPR
jgi:UDP-N-acetylglucosamine--N-acetylmuramyl-(pentapeptide) pyrophosphoryl-undecaprenol N-acetylglucosamine transferase